MNRVCTYLHGDCFCISHYVNPPATIFAGESVKSVVWPTTTREKALKRHLVILSTYFWVSCTMYNAVELPGAVHDNYIKDDQLMMTPTWTQKPRGYFISGLVLHGTGEHLLIVRPVPRPKWVAATSWIITPRRDALSLSTPRARENLSICVPRAVARPLVILILFQGHINCKTLVSIYWCPTDCWQDSGAQCLTFSLRRVLLFEWHKAMRWPKRATAPPLGDDRQSHEVALRPQVNST